jgi:hypothetical protein
MQYVFATPIPIPWMLADILTVAVTAGVLLFAIRRSRHPGMVILEGLAFVFLYAGLFENFAVVNGWYRYGRSLLMFGDVPLSVPLIEIDVFLTGLWILEKTNLPMVFRPLVLGLFGMLQDLSLDPLAVRQTFAAAGQTTGRWTWLITPDVAQIYNIPVYNFPGWMLIMLYGSIYILIGRALFRKSGYRPWVGYVYPFAATILALITMVTPLSQFLLWLAPVGSKGGAAEWIMFGFFLTVPTLLLLSLTRGKVDPKPALSLYWPMWIAPLIFHAADLFWIAAGGFWEVLWLAVLATAAHAALLAWIWSRGWKTGSPAQLEPQFSP